MPHEAHTPYHFEIMTKINNALTETHVLCVKQRKNTGSA